jgi:hypothetical protein
MLMKENKIAEFEDQSENDLKTQIYLKNLNLKGKRVRELTPKILY